MAKTGTKIKHIIVDASVAQKWFDENEIHSELAQEILQGHLEGESIIFAHQLFFYELTNIWACKGNLPEKIIILNFKRLKTLQIEIEAQTLADLEMAAKLAKKYKISAYDASYIVLAQKKKCDFVTADQKLVSKVNLPFVKTLQ
ncbi:MAG: Ribonuclease VapC [Microgenomates group bacterium Gr01-1014_5]|nr:MAG: Ribonuclease VapC [Microgenomates group bacterium Gr01-1014_5]